MKAIGYRGEGQSLQQTGNAIWLVFGITAVIIHLLLAAQVESFIHPAMTSQPTSAPRDTAAVHETP